MFSIVTLKADNSSREVLMYRLRGISSVIFKCLLMGLRNYEAVLAEYEIKASINKKKPREVYIFKRANAQKIKSLLTDMRNEFLDTYMNKDIEENWHFFKDNILKAVKEHVPTKTIKGNADLPWLSRKVKKLLKRRKRKYEKEKVTGNESDWNDYKILQKQLKVEIKRAHDSYLESIFESDKKEIINKRLWSYMKLLKREKVGIDALGEDGKVVRDW